MPPLKMKAQKNIEDEDMDQLEYTETNQDDR